MSSTLWPMLRDERVALAAYLRTLAPEDWARPSPCAGWTVHDVAAHLVAGAKSTPPRFVAAMVTSGFDFDKALAKQRVREAGASSAELVESLDRLAARKNPPVRVMLGEVVVHGADIRGAVGAPPGEHPAELLREVADYYRKAGGPPLRVKKRIEGLRLEATDIDWSTGDGPVVRGPAVPLLQAMSGRPAGLSALTGEGVDVLRSRL